MRSCSRPYPLKLNPVCKSYIWGGTRLKTEFAKTSDKEIIAESWELSCHPNGESVIANGEFSGLALTRFLSGNPGFAGKKYDESGKFPILVKLIDAKDNLSVQVHPGGEFGKAEVWYIVDCRENAEIICGLKDGVSKEDLVRHINNKTLLDIVNKIPVRKGDMFFIGPGTLHAIGKGILIAEIQQNSNVTYRVYDYDRKDLNGNLRELHVNKALDAIKLKTEFNNINNYFNIAKYKTGISEKIKFTTGENSFNSLLFLEGRAEIDGVDFKKGDCCFVPAKYGDYIIKNISDRATEFLFISLPD